jgi:hypothetical protein
MSYLSKIKRVFAIGFAFTVLSSSAAFADEIITTGNSNQIILSDLADLGTDDMYVVITGYGDDEEVAIHSDSYDQAIVLKNLPVGYNLSVLGQENSWLYVQDDEGDVGYIRSDFVAFKNGEKPANTTASSALAQQIVDYSKQFLGRLPYVWGGTSLTSGADCSGFVMSIYKNFGITLTRTSRSQYASDGVYVARENLQPGDLVFFNKGGSTAISHVGMYIGDGKYINESDYSTGCIISDLSKAVSKGTYVGAKRIIQ